MVTRAESFARPKSRGENFTNSNSRREWRMFYARVLFADKYTLNHPRLQSSLPSAIDASSGRVDGGCNDPTNIYGTGWSLCATESFISGLILSQKLLDTNNETCLANLIQCLKSVD